MFPYNQRLKLREEQQEQRQTQIDRQMRRLLFIIMGACALMIVLSILLHKPQDEKQTLQVEP
jgi:hypothetical protein